MKTIFDIGMYDGADTTYYLECGYRVIAVEANPELTQQVQQTYADQIASGQLTCINAAISPNGDPVELNLSGKDLGSSTLFGERIAHKVPMGSVTVPGVTLEHLIEKYGIPDYLKVDIEGADRLCILPLTSETRPAFLSFEIGDDVDELLAHTAKIGYSRFKIINQNSFREIKNLQCLYDRVAYRLMRYMGYARPQLIKRAGRFFTPGHSSGPVPWRSDGRWRSADETRSLLRTSELPGWFDIHATTDQ